MANLVRCRVINNGYVSRRETVERKDGTKEERLVSYSNGEVFSCPIKEAQEYIQSKPYPLVEIVEDDNTKPAAVEEKVEKGAQQEPTTARKKVGKDGVARKAV